MGNDKHVVDAPDVVRFTLTVRREENPELYWWLRSHPNRKASALVRKLLDHALQQAKIIGAIEHPTAILAAQRSAEMAKTQVAVMEAQSVTPAPGASAPMVAVAQSTPTVRSAPILKPSSAVAQDQPASEVGEPGVDDPNAHLDPEILAIMEKMDAMF